jgi:hypothetical protein
MVLEMLLHVPIRFNRLKQWLLFKDLLKISLMVLS